jgi:hypothetical protein
MERVEQFQLDAAKFSTIRNRTIANSLKALGPPYSEQRREQMEKVQNDDSLKTATAFSILSSTAISDWQEWFMSRKEGCCFIESIRGESSAIDLHCHILRGG